MTDKESDLIIQKTIFCAVDYPPLPRPELAEGPQPPYRFVQQAEIQEPSRWLLLALLAPGGMLAVVIYLVVNYA